MCFMDLRRSRFLTLIVILLAVIGIIVFHQELLRALGRALWWVQQTQNRYSRELTQLISSLRHGSNGKTLWFLAGLSFVYGILHAVGPGHGKAIIAAFVMTQKSSYRSALGIAVAGGLLQGVSAIIWVACTIGIMQLLVHQAINAVEWAQVASFALTIGIGFYLLWRGVAVQHHEHAHAHGEHCGCQHHHGVSAEASKGDLKAHAMAAFAIGVRPCSGALLVLAVSALWHLWWVGIVMTMTLALGTVITVAALALLTIFGRNRLALALTDGAQQLHRLARWASVLGGVLIILLGSLMLYNTLQHPVVPLPL